MAKRNNRRERGFTLIELMIVISMILILVSISIPAYNQSILRAKESVLRQDLFQLRSLISQYTLDKQKAPQSLDDLVQAGYIKQIPMDPMTGSNSTWTVDQEDTVMSVDQQEPGISDVHSGAAQTPRATVPLTAAGKNWSWLCGRGRPPAAFDLKSRGRVARDHTYHTIQHQPRHI